MLGRPAIDRNPEGEPDESKQACRDERGLPAPLQRNGRNDERRDDRADVRACIEYPGRERALLDRKPFRNGLDGSRKVSRFAYAKGESREAESGD